MTTDSLKDSLKRYRKKPRLPLDEILLQMYDAMESVFAYDHDRNYVPDANELAAFDLLKREMAGHCAMLLIIVETMHQRADKAAASLLTPPRKGEGS